MKIGQLIELLKEDNRRKTVTYYKSPGEVIRVTKSHKQTKQSKSRTFSVSVGKPNYAARQFIKLCLAAGEPFPVRRPQIAFYPEKRKKRK